VIITRRSNITRVLRTSRGVVTAAATAPAALPHAAASYEWSCLPRSARDNRYFRNSYRGNCIDVNGICNGTLVGQEMWVERGFANVCEPHE